MNQSIAYDTPHPSCSTTDEYFMSQALQEAEVAASYHEVPVGAVLVHGDDILARGHNGREWRQDPTAHAELEVIREAASRLNSWRLDKTTLYVTLEPCLMCAGAILQARIPHLVFGTIHAASAASTIGRILDLFPDEMHAALRSALAFNMRGIDAQKLLPSIRPDVSRVPCVDVMTFSSMIRKLILEGNDDKLPDAIRMGEPDGMQDFTLSLKKLIDAELIDRPTAFEVAPNKEALKMALKGIDVSQPGIL